MYIQVTENMFVDAFDSANRSENFSIEARRTLFEFYEEMEEDGHTSTELDVIAICCDWTEYSDLQELYEEYSVEYDEYAASDDELENEIDWDNFREWIEERTLVLDVGNTGGVLVQNF